ncbi:MAG: hypothetical protein [Wigfec virus K19_160]|nr:MAG: hypothetical protein [Wigfec virus K19_160]
MLENVELSFLNFLIPAVAGLAGAGISAMGAKSAASKTADSNLMAAEMNTKYQKEFAQSGIQWRVRDAQKAGIHPLAALGAQTHSYSPSYVGTQYPNALDPVGTAVASAGQDLGRAVAATSPAQKQANNYAQTAQQLTLQKMSLENDLLASQIAKLNQAGGIPAPQAAVGNRYVIDGQGDTAKPIVDVPLERVGFDGGHREAGPHNDIGYIKTRDGYAPVPSETAKERFEDDLLGSVIWNVRNRILPSMGINRDPPPYAHKTGFRWVYDVVKQQYRQVPTRNDTVKGGGGW